MIKTTFTKTAMMLTVSVASLSAMDAPDAAQPRGWLQAGFEMANQFNPLPVAFNVVNQINPLPVVFAAADYINPFPALYGIANRFNPFAAAQPVAPEAAAAPENLDAVFARIMENGNAMMAAFEAQNQAAMPALNAQLQAQIAHNHRIDAMLGAPLGGNEDDADLEAELARLMAAQ